MTELTHPKAIAARAIADQNKLAKQQQKAEQKVYREALKAIVAKAWKNGIRFITEGDLTVCYNARNGDVIEISTALRNPKDKFDKLEGRMQALSNFYDNKTILLKKDKDMTAYEFMQEYFVDSVTFS